ncbi:MAG: DUF3006 domain-containing protein [Clostridia bacterium]|nr:DUF3006 domain-containing protein [Clostridia bacterium]
MKYVIDRIENDIAVCESHDTSVSEQKFNVCEFPFEIHEGLIFLLETVDGKQRFTLFEDSINEEAEQKKAIRSKLDKLFKRK